MLPEFPKLKEKLDELYIQRWHRRILAHGILANLPAATVLQEGDKIGVQREDESSSNDEMQHHSVKFEISAEELDHITTEELLAKWDKAAQEMQAAMTEQLFRTVEKACDDVGNVVHGAGRPFRETFMEMQEAVEWSFESDGRRSPGSSMVLHPDAFERIQSEIPFMLSDEDYCKRMRELENRKREEWRAREADRKLVG